MKKKEVHEIIDDLETDEYSLIVLSLSIRVLNIFPNALISLSSQEKTTKDVEKDRKDSIFIRNKLNFS
jgi:hypothetical protein